MPALFMSACIVIPAVLGFLTALAHSALGGSTAKVKLTTEIYLRFVTPGGPRRDQGIHKRGTCAAVLTSARGHEHAEATAISPIAARAPPAHHGAPAITFPSSQPRLRPSRRSISSRFSRARGVKSRPTEYCDPPSSVGREPCGAVGGTPRDGASSSEEAIYRWTVSSPSPAPPFPASCRIGLH
jgi:hypothetical protein